MKPITKYDCFWQGTQNIREDNYVLTLLTLEVLLHKTVIYKLEFKIIMFYRQILIY